MAFTSRATNLIMGSTSGPVQVYVRDRTANTTSRASISGSGALGNSDSDYAVISPDGTRVAFTSSRFRTDCFRIFQVAYFPTAWPNTSSRPFGSIDCFSS